MGMFLGKLEQIYPKATFVDHKREINCFATSKDCSVAASGSGDTTIRIWNLIGNLKCVGILKGHESYVTDVAFQDTFIISGSADNTIRKWDMITCECIYVYKGHTDSIFKVILTGEYFISSSADKTVRVWLTEAEEVDENEICVCKLIGHIGTVVSMIYMPERNTHGDDIPGIQPNDVLITASTDSTARSWSLKTENQINVFRGHKGPLSMIRIDPDKEMFYSGSEDKTIRLWIISTGECKRVIEGHEGAITSLFITSTMVFAGDSAGVVKAWVRQTGDFGLSYKGHQHAVSEITIYNGLLYTACADKYVRAYNPKSGELKRKFVAHRRGITAMKLYEGKMFTTGNEGYVIEWELATKKPEYMMDEEEKLEYLETKRMLKAEKRRHKKNSRAQMIIEEDSDDDDDITTYLRKQTPKIEVEQQNANTSDKENDGEIPDKMPVQTHYDSLDDLHLSEELDKWND